MHGCSVSALTLVLTRSVSNYIYFSIVFAAAPGYAIGYSDVGNAGIEGEVLEARIAKETAAAADFVTRFKAKRFGTLGHFHGLLFGEHMAYAAGRLVGERPAPVVDPRVLASY